MTPRQPRAASPSVETSAPSGAQSPAACFEAGLRLLKAGQMAETEQCGRQALSIDSGHADSLHLMGLLCVVARQDDLAIDWFAQAIGRDPNVADYFSNLATALGNRGRLAEAIKSLDRALVLKPDWAEVWLRMGMLLQHQDLLRQAQARTVDTLWDLIGRSLKLFTPDECANYSVIADIIRFDRNTL
jgi:tetratricopeptide (TPR) repeat protein